MIYTLSIILLAAIFSWVLTLHYQAQLVEAKVELAEKESDRIIDMGLLSQDYEKRIKMLEDENSMLRRRLG